MQARAQTVLPRFIASPAPLCLWLLLGCLISVSVLASLARVPVYRNGTVVVVTAKDEELIVAFFSPESKSEIKTGQNLSFKLDPAGPPLVRAITAVEPEILSPANARKKFQLDGVTAWSYRGPAVVAVARLGKPDKKLPASTYQGTVVEARVEIGSQRLLAFLPVVGSWLEGL